MGTLYIVATPIGNLQDVSFRCVKTLHSVQYIICEDTRRTGLLLRHIQGTLPTLQVSNNPNKPKLISYYEQNELQRIPQVIEILKTGKDVALVSDAGTPAISDPGFKLIRECVRENIKVESIPGPSSVISALVVSGLPTNKFLFVGYLPLKSGHKNKFLKSLFSMLQILETTVILFEAPHKLAKTLEDIKDIFGDIEIVIVRELTKIHEEIRREKLSIAVGYYSKINPKGEFVILFNLKSHNK